MGDLADRKCVPCRGGVPPLEPEEVARLHRSVPDWEVVENHHLRRTFATADFVTALRLVNRIGELAEEEWHHPDLHLAWGKVGVEIWTHKIDGLTESDFILAAKIDRIAAS
ncbi:MAG: 4a-hydroxytetrahydrobiopterin dehydratase [Acidobacteriota bacterium]|jgi:4a-hydroxytetrahydrobiopterin dehydratase